MSITYPLSLPTTTGIASITLRAVNQTLVSESPVTFKQQVFAQPGKKWEADVSLPPMLRDDAEIWLGFLLSLKGRAGTFTMGDPLGATAQGTLGGTPLVSGASQTGGSLNIDGATHSVTNWLKAGDYVQLGSASSATLHKVLANASSDGTGAVTLDLWPDIRTAPADNSTVTTSNCVGVWRLNSGITDWSVDSAVVYGISFSAVEAVT